MRSALKPFVALAALAATIVIVLLAFGAQGFVGTRTGQPMEFASGGGEIRTLDLADGSRIGDLGSFTRADGTTGTMGDADLVQDTFFREFTDDVPVSADVAALPDMQGSGKVRDLQQAANDTCNRLRA